MKRISLVLVLFIAFSQSLAMAEPGRTDSRWACLADTRSSQEIFSLAGTSFESYTAIGEVTLFLGREPLLDLLKSKGIEYTSFPLRPEESAWLLTSKEPALRKRVFPGARIILNTHGFRVLLANETAKMGMASKMSDFSKVEPLPQNTVLMTLPVPPSKKKVDDPLVPLLNRLDRDAFAADVKALVDVKTRYTYSDGAVKALDYCEKTFRDLGLAVKRLPFSGSGAKRDNLEAFQKGFDDANAGEVFIVGHLDSTSPKASTFAPGADDNGSGAAGVMAIARFMKGLNPRASVRYVLFLGEEQGMVGSKAYVAGLTPQELAKIRAVINMDMIGFDVKAPPSVMLETASFNTQMADQMTELTAKYTSMSSVISYNPWGSDHMPFLKKEIPTVLTIESEFDDNPTYHQVTDLPDKMNLDLCMGILRLNAATLAELASVERTPR